MSKATSPFAGIKLSDQTSLGSGGKLDQQLFTTPPKKQAPPVISSKETQNSGNPETRKSGNPELQESVKPDFRESGTPGIREIGKPEIRDTSPVQAAHPDFLFNINDNPTIKETFLITDGEYDSMEAMKLQIRRLFDMKASKQDIIRCAVQHVLEEFQKHPEASIIVSRLKQKKK